MLFLTSRAAAAALLESAFEQLKFFDENKKLDEDQQKDFCEKPSVAFTMETFNKSWHLRFFFVRNNA
jgi:hypothetical protein